jgi:hypothetical protein
MYDRDGNHLLHEDSGKSLEERESNGKVLESSHDLAEACVEFLRQLGTGAIQVFDTDDDIATEGSNDICQMIEAAVKKAGIEVSYE